MFSDKDRTKFSDFIIPVIPVINSSNSNEKLSERIKESKYGNDLREEFINEITVFIDDMRIINNIFNEYYLYSKNLSGVVLNSEKLFCIIVYKNIYPRDFAVLQFNGGVVAKAFSQKSIVVTEKVEEIQNQYKQLEELLQKIEHEHLNSLREMRASLTAEQKNNEFNAITIIFSCVGKIKPVPCNVIFAWSTQGR